MLTGKQRRYLRSHAHHLSSILQVGKSGVSEAFLQQVSLALEANELIKIGILQNCDEDRHEVAEKLAEETGSELVQVLGKTVVLYRPSSTHPQITLP
ncbi:MAG: ribosome assembly RNA-binding protein YhbY [Blastocatellia bacterium]|nr:ribosome assembly RNA-binding protein YhbY [Blastocatellia bacterium]